MINPLISSITISLLHIDIFTRKPEFVVCMLQRRRPACTSVQTDLRVCSLLLIGIVSKLVHEIFH